MWCGGERCCFDMAQVEIRIGTPVTPVTIQKAGTSNGTKVDVGVYWDEESRVWMGDGAVGRAQKSSAGISRRA